MAGINIPFLANVRDFLRGTKDVEDGLDDVSDALDDVARESERTNRETGRDLDDTARDADTAAGKMERSFKEAFDDVKRESRQAGDDIASDAERGTGRAADAAAEFKNEATQNFAQTASSFDGSMESIADMAQGTLGGLATAIPGAGVFAGLGAAAGGAWLAQWNKSREEAKENHNEMLDDLIESEANYLSESYQQQQYWDILKGESKILSENKLRELVEMTGMSEQEVALAFAGNQALMARARERVNEKYEEAVQLIHDEGFAHDRVADQNQLITGRALTLIDQRTQAIANSIDEAERGRRVLEDWSSALRNLPPETKVKVVADLGDIEGQIRRHLSGKTFHARMEAQFTSRISAENP